MPAASVGFIGLGVMGEPICRNMARKSGRAMHAFDLSPEPLARLARDGVKTAPSVDALAKTADIIFLSLPSGAQVKQVCESGLLRGARPGQIIVDLGTSPVALARDLARQFAAKGASFADAPVARTREAAEKGTLSIMVGASPSTFVAIKPLLDCAATEVTHCGDVGSGQVVKIMNNMVLFQTVVAICEALALARRSGVDGALLFETLSKGSADSFALRNHGMKAVLPGSFPERAFSTDYALKDLGYALDLAKELGVATPGAELAGRLLRAASEAGLGGQYWPVIAKIIDRK